MNNYTDAINRMAALNDTFRAENGRRRSAFARTFGCQMNAHDSEKLLGMCADMGFDIVQDEKDADLVIFNTCCVRENAENKIFGNIGWLKNLKRQKPGFKAVLCGCMVQQDAALEKIRQTHKHVDIIFGTFNIHRFPEMLFTSYESDTNEMLIDIWKEHEINVPDEGNLPIIYEHSFRAPINIMYGCDNFCAYCIVPYVRGREKSRLPMDILAEAERAVRSGAKEILLLGQNVNSYGKGLENADFPRLLREISSINGLERIRFMTSHPKDLSEDLIAAMRDLPNVCKHLHLPFQSGSTRVLKAMNRHYSKEGYLALVERLRLEMPELALTTDIIVGFPGETEEDFQDTLDIAKTARFSGAFTFYYSPRSGTPAAKMPPIDEAAVKDRFDRLTAVTNGITYEINRSFEGKTVNVLAEKREDGIISGRTESNALVHFKGGANLVGEITAVKITEGKPFYLMGER